MTSADTAAPPAGCGVAFKEWEGVCEALARGRQSLILRKGGIDEGPGGFRPEHDAFWLYPTRVHQAQQGLKPEGVALAEAAAASAATAGGTVILGALAVVTFVGRVEDPGRLAALDGLHVWTAETVAARFHYRRPGLWVLGVRVYRLDRPHALAVTPEHAGCKTWVPVEPPLPAVGLVPALGGAEFAAEMDRLRSRLGPPGGPRG